MHNDFSETFIMVSRIYIKFEIRVVFSGDSFVKTTSFARLSIQQLSYEMTACKPFGKGLDTAYAEPK